MAKTKQTTIEHVRETMDGDGCHAARCVGATGEGWSLQVKLTESDEWAAVKPFIGLSRKPSAMVRCLTYASVKPEPKPKTAKPSKAVSRMTKAELQAYVAALQS